MKLEERLKNSGLYTADESGNIYSQHFGRNRRMVPNRFGVYLSFNAHMGNKQYTASVHRFVWCYLCGNIPKGLEINHINANKHDNRLSNLELVTRRGNALHAKQMGLLKKPVGHCQGTKNPRAKLTEEQAREIEFLSRIGIRTGILCKHFKIGATMIREIRAHNTWKHLWEK